jgi:hypothetical protein
MKSSATLAQAMTRSRLTDARRRRSPVRALDVVASLSGTSGHDGVCLVKVSSER